MKRAAALALFGALLICGVAAGTQMMNVGSLMSPDAGTGSGPPPASYALLTEAGDRLITESSNVLVTEDAP